MQILIQTDKHIDGNDAFAKWASDAIQADLARFGDQITRVQAFFSDENAGKKDTADSIQCTLEVRLEGRQPLVLKHNGGNLNQAVAGASEKMARLLESTLGKSASI